jgi:hypothetical protein
MRMFGKAIGVKKYYFSMLGRIAYVTYALQVSLADVLAFGRIRDRAFR